MLWGASAGAQTAPARSLEPRAQRAPRTVDLEPFLTGFPYLRWTASAEAGELLFMRDEAGGRRLHAARAGEGRIELDRVPALGSIDWNRRGIRSFRWDAPRGRYLVLADEANEERFNVWSLERSTGELTRLTDVDYVYGFGLDNARTRLAWIPRQGQREPFHTCLHLRDLATGQDTERSCDTEALRYTWSEPVFRPSGTGLVLTALGRGDRDHQTLLYVDLADPSAAPRPLLDFNARRRNVSVVRRWPEESRFFYTSDESGYTNVYAFDLTTFGIRAITSFHDDVDGVAALEVGGRHLLAVTVNRPAESSLYLVDPESGSIRDNLTLPRRIELLDGEGDRLFVRMESRTERFVLEQLRVVPTSETPRFERSELAVAPPAAQPDVCTVERVRVPTFDDDASTHARRELHAFLHVPRALPPRGERLAAVESFYGGVNNWDLTASVLCAAGVIVLSPSVRGSSGFGAEFAALNDRDLGGNEVFDLVFAARWLVAQQRLGLAEERVGLFGASHGGYEVQRALTMPPDVNHRTEPFRWGFGVSWFGFSDILHFYEHSNIPDWVRLEAGDPATQAERLRDRSPLTHAARLSAPLLLLHGENDRRVSVLESRRMHAALQAAHRPSRYVEFPGQGHGLKGVPTQRRVYHEVLRFLRERLPPAHASGSHRGRRAAASLAVLAGVLGLLGAAGLLRLRRV